MRLVQRAMEELSEAAPEPSGDPRAIIGMMADEPDVMDRACELAMQFRRESRMRSAGG